MEEDMSGVAGRTDYRDWDKKTNTLVEQHEQEEEQELEQAKKALGLDGKYAHSEVEAQERQKAKEVKKVKKVLDSYRKREGDYMQTFSGLLGDHTESAEETKSAEATIVRLTRDHLEAGKRVVTLCDSTGASQNDLITLTQDLSHLESRMKTNNKIVPNDNDEDADNGVKDQAEQERTIYGLIKVFLSNLKNCTVIIRCKLISGTVEMNHCSNLVLKIEQEATAATLQIDLCQDIRIEFHDAPSGKNTNLPGQPKMYWGEDKDDRIFHAGVKQMKVVLYRDGYIDMETSCDYLMDGAVTIGNASAEEYQFVTSVVDGDLHTEQVVRHGATTGKNARAMTQRELDEEKKKREQAAAMAVQKAEDMIKVIGKDGHEVTKKEVIETAQKEDNEDIEEVYASMPKSEIDHIVADCEQNKSRGNEAFGAGEYAQAVLLYSLALDKAEELPDKGAKQLFPRHVVLANRSASFLKLGEHEKALADGTKAQMLDPTYVKGIFRKGLALHALGRYEEAIQALASAQMLEPNNKQIKQSLQFAEVRMTQEMRKRMGEQ
jgi:hypothetical protein